MFATGNTGTTGRRLALAGSTALALAIGYPAAVQPARAQTPATGFPTKPIHVAVTLSPGSATDIVARVVLDQVGRQLGQSIVIENRTGAGGTIGANAVAKADPDGYMLLVNSNAHTIAPAIFAKMPYDVLADFTNITSLGAAPHVAIIAPAQNINTLKDLIAAVKSRPGGLVYGAVAATAPHLNAEHFRKATNIEARMVPFKGAPEAITEVVANRIDIYWSPVLPALPFIEDKQLVGLAVSSRKRSSVLPNVPTTFEQGYDDSEFGLWFGFYGPAKMPKDILAKIYEETAKSLANPEIQDKLKKLGIEQHAMKPDEFDAYVRRQVQVDGELAKQAGLSKQ